MLYDLQALDTSRACCPERPVLLCINAPICGHMDLQYLSMPQGGAAGVGAAAPWALGAARAAGRLNVSCLAGLRRGHAAAACTTAISNFMMTQSTAVLAAVIFLTPCNMPG